MSSPYYIEVNNILRSEKQYRTAIRFLENIHGAAVTYFKTGNSDPFFEFIESNAAAVIAFGRVHRLKHIINSIKPYTSSKDKDPINTEIENLVMIPTLSKETDIKELLADYYNIPPEDVLKRVVAPLTAMRRLTFIYGFFKLYQNIHKLPKSIRNINDVPKGLNDDQCEALKRNLEDERDKLKEIVVKLMLFHSEYMDVKEVAKNAAPSIDKTAVDDPVAEKKPTDPKKTTTDRTNPQILPPKTIAYDKSFETEIDQQMNFIDPLNKLNAYLTQLKETIRQHISQNEINQIINYAKKLQSPLELIGTSTEKKQQTDNYNRQLQLIKEFYNKTLDISKTKYDDIISVINEINKYRNKIENGTTNSNELKNTINKFFSELTIFVKEREERYQYVSKLKQNSAELNKKDDTILENIVDELQNSALNSLLLNLRIKIDIVRKAINSFISTITKT